MSFPKSVKLVEVSPRDGLQNEKQTLSIADKVMLINALSQTGVKLIEAGSLVSPDWVPQMADSESVYQQIDKKENIAYPLLVPNKQGLERALLVGAKQIAIFTAASETFSQKNINCSIAESIDRYREVMDLALQNDIEVRGYISCVLGCPFEGSIVPAQVVSVAMKLKDLGIFEVSLGDTIGVGTPRIAQEMIQAVQDVFPLGMIALHYHDTYGQALANIYASLELGVTTFDTSVAGLGGCPYAKGATGNVATEDVLYLLKGLGIETGIDLEKMIKVGHDISQKLNRKNASKVSIALTPRL